MWHDKYFRRFLVIILLAIAIFLAWPAFAEDSDGRLKAADTAIPSALTTMASDAPAEGSNTITMAEAQVLQIIRTSELLRDSGQKVIQQDLELGILTGPLKGQRVQYHGISDIDVVTANAYKVNDRVIVNYSRDENGQYVFFVTDYVRRRPLQWLLFLFLATVVAVGGKKGFLLPPRFLC